MTSLRRQLSLGLALSLVGLLTLQWAVVTFMIDDLIQSQMTARMQQEAESLLAAASVDAHGRWQLEPRVMTATYQRPFSGHYFVLIGADRTRLQSRSWWDWAMAAAPLAVGQEQVRQVSGPEAQPLLMLGHGYRKQHQRVTIYVAESLAPLQQSVRWFHWIYGGFSLLGLMALLALQRWIVVRSLHPLQQIKQSLAQVASGELQQIHSRGPAEVMPLVNEFNRIVKNAIQKSRRSRLAIGNLAHGLKTRLAQLQILSEQATDATLPAFRQAVQACSEDIHRDVERELKRARLMGDVYTSQHTDLTQELPRLVATLQKIYSEKAVVFAWQLEGESRLPVDREDLLELLGNLLDNAFKWCHGRVTLHVSTVAGLQLSVEDDGPGTAATELECLLKRGLRMDESKPGSGLGLAIVQDIVQHYHGQIALSHSATLGGLRVQLHLMPV